MAEWEVSSCVCGYNVYESIWVAALGERVVCIREPLNSRDRFAVVLKKNGVVISHLPQNISQVCSSFIRRGGTIECIVTGTRRHSTYLPQGGLEIPCVLLFTGQRKEINKVKLLFTKKMKD